MAVAFSALLDLQSWASGELGLWLGKRRLLSIPAIAHAIDWILRGFQGSKSRGWSEVQLAVIVIIGRFVPLQG